MTYIKASSHLTENILIFFATTNQLELFRKTMEVYCKTDTRYMMLMLMYFVLITEGFVETDTCVSRGIQRDSDASEQQRRFPADE
jgi:hypothetical protein